MTLIEQSRDYFAYSTTLPYSQLELDSKCSQPFMHIHHRLSLENTQKQALPLVSTDTTFSSLKIQKSVLFAVEIGFCKVFDSIILLHLNFLAAAGKQHLLSKYACRLQRMRKRSNCSYCCCCLLACITTTTTTFTTQKMVILRRLCCHNNGLQHKKGVF